MQKQNLSLLSNNELDSSLKSLVTRELEISSDILLHICEVDRRKMYLDFSFGSLFDYLTQHHKFSNASAQRRIYACRLSLEVPSVIEDLQSGGITLAQVELVQKYSKQAAKEKALSKSIEHALFAIAPSDEKSKDLSTEAIPGIQTKKELLEALKQKSFFESQAIVAKAFDIEVKSVPVVKQQSDGSVRLEVTFSKEEWEKLNKMRELISHSLPSGSWDLTLVHVAEKIIAAKTNVRKQSEVVKSKKKLEETETPRFQDHKSIEKRSFYQNRKILLKQYDCCQYQDTTKRIACTSKWQLQVDHIKPKWAGGTDELSNLRVLCGMHNRMIYREQSRIKVVQ